MLFILFREKDTPINLMSMTFGGLLFGAILYMTLAPFMLHKNLGLTFVLHGMTQPFQYASVSRSVAFIPTTLQGLMVWYNIALPVLSIFGIHPITRKINRESNLLLLVFLIILLYPVIFKGQRFLVYLVLPTAVLASVGFSEAYRTAIGLTHGASGKMCGRLIIGLLVGLLLCSYSFGLLRMNDMKPVIYGGTEKLLEFSSKQYPNEKVFSYWDRGHLLAYHGLLPFNDGYPSMENSPVYDYLESRVWAAKSESEMEKLLTCRNAKIIYIEPGRHMGKLNVPSIFENSVSYDKNGLCIEILQRPKITCLYRKNDLHDGT